MLIVLAIGWIISRLLDALLREYIKPLTVKSETDLDDQLMPIICKGMKIIVWGLAMRVLQDIVDGNEALEDKSVIGFAGFGDFSLNLLFVYYI